MSANGLVELKIEHLRGSVIPFTLPFEKGKKLTLVYGENGTGKTTICDAFDFLGKGNVGSLDNRGLGQTPRYWPSVGKNASDISVTLKVADGGECRGSLTKSGVSISPQEARPRVETLRRKQILDLIEAQPAKRYEAIRRFIDVSGIETSEAALGQLIKSLDEGRNEAVARVAENQDTIKNFWETAGKPAPDMFIWAESEVAHDSAVLAQEALALYELYVAHNRLTDYPRLFDEATKSLTEAQDELKHAKEEVAKHVSAMAEDSAELVALLQGASDFLHLHPSPDVCPLCESGAQTKDLEARVLTRLNAFGELQRAQAHEAATSKKVQQAENRLTTLNEGLMRHAQDFQEVRMANTLPANVPLPDAPAPAGISELGAWLSKNSDLPEKWKTAENERHDSKKFRATLSSSLATYRENVAKQRAIDRLLPRLTKALDVIVEERRKFTDDILSKIAEEVGSLYEMVHPGEGLNKISLELDPKKRASLDIGTEFHGRSGAPPQAYFSDSHLDTLGLVVFLALAALDAPGNTILVLDDILASVDEPHVERLIEMLYAEALKFRHCIVTTHYRPWREKLRWGWLKVGPCQFVELTKWTPSDGITTTSAVYEVKALRKLLSTPPYDLQSICSKAGVILERVLDFLTQQYQCSVPRRPHNEYSLRDLMDAIDKKLRQSLRVEVYQSVDGDGKPVYKEVLLGGYLDELARVAQTRNAMGCHFKEISYELLDADALHFGKQVLELMDALTDDEAGWPRKDKSGSYWATAGETRRLHPLKKPS